MQKNSSVKPLSCFSFYSTSVITQWTHRVSLLRSANHFTQEVFVLKTDMCSKHEAIPPQNLLIYCCVILKMFETLLVFVTVLSTARLKGKYIMQMSQLRSKTGNKAPHKAVGDRHCQNVLRGVFNSPAACLLRLQNLTTGLWKRPFCFIQITLCIYDKSYH
jgi:hypothetical protein